MVVHKSGGKDDYGDPLPGEDTTVTGVLLDPFDTSNENSDRRNQTVTEITVHDPSYCDIGPSDTVTLNGLLWEVIGDPVRPESPMTGWRPSQRINLRRVTG